MKLLLHVSILFAGVFVLVSVLTACSGGNVALIEQKCNSCHGFEGSYAQERTASEWQRVVTGMKAMGMKVTEAEERKVVKALAAEYGR